MARTKTKCLFIKVYIIERCILKELSSNVLLVITYYNEIIQDFK